jgi:hypothetical protein
MSHESWRMLFSFEHYELADVAAGVTGMPPVSQAERTFVWTLITEITAVCGGGASVDFMLEAWQVISKHINAHIAAGRAFHSTGMQEEGAAILRAIATSVDLLSLQQVGWRLLYHFELTAVRSLM